MLIQDYQVQMGTIYNTIKQNSVLKYSFKNKWLIN